jgi:hypothetical protein
MHSHIWGMLPNDQIGVMRVVCSSIEDVYVYMTGVRASNYSQNWTWTRYVGISYLLHEYMIVVGLHVLQLAIL